MLGTDVLSLPVAEGALLIASAAIDMAPSLKAFDLGTTHVFWEHTGTPYLSIDSQLAEPLLDPDDQQRDQASKDLRNLKIVQTLLVYDDGYGDANLGVDTLWGSERLASLDNDEYLRYIYETFAKYFEAIRGPSVPLDRKLIAQSHLPDHNAEAKKANEHKYLHLADSAAPQA